jgi:hypothetical protein
MKDYVQRHGRCPVTHYPCSNGDDDDRNDTTTTGTLIRLQEPGIL